MIVSLIFPELLKESLLISIVLLANLLRSRVIGILFKCVYIISHIFKSLQVVEVLCFIYDIIPCSLTQVELADPFDNPVVQRLYDEWLGQPGSEKAKRFLHTEYHPLVKSTASQLHNW